MMDGKKKGGLAVVIGASPSGEGGGGSEYDADAKAFRKALDRGDGAKFYEILKGVIEECLQERGESESEDED